MPTIYKQNRMVCFLSQISRKSRVSLTFLSFLLTSCFLFFFFFYPLLVQNQDSNLELENLLAQQIVYEKTAVKLPQFEKQNLELNANLKSVLENRNKNNLQSMLHDLKKFNLICKRVEPDNLDPSKNINSEKKAHTFLKTKGEFEDFVNYFDFAQNSYNSIKFKEMNFKINRKNQIKASTKIKFRNYEKLKA